MEFWGGKTYTRRIEQLTGNSTPQQLFNFGVDVPSGKWVFHLGWVLKTFQVGRYKFQVGVGGKTWKCVLYKMETATKSIKTRHFLGWKYGRKIPMQSGYCKPTVENSILVLLVTFLNISS